MKSSPSYGAEVRPHQRPIVRVVFTTVWFSLFYTETCRSNGVFESAPGNLAIMRERYYHGGMNQIVVGSRVPSPDDGITFMDFNPQRGTLSYRRAVGGIEMPTYQAWDREKRILYTVSEGHEGKVFGYRVDEDLQLETVMTASTLGSGPCHLALSPDRRSLAVSNYNDGVFTLIALEDGGLPNYSEQYEDSSIHIDRQESSHVHCALFVDGSSSMLVTDLGGDTIHYYRNELRLRDAIAAPPGSGPRHLVLSSDERYLFVSAELSSEVLVYAMGKTPTLIQQISTIPPGFGEENTASAIALSIDGRFLYVGNRGHDSIAIFSVKEGWLSRHSWCYTERKPWDFALAGDERFMIVANTSSNSLTVYPRDAESGALGQLAHRISVDRPSCITLL
jgi:6-phosphogluconolactonase